MFRFHFCESDRIAASFVVPAVTTTVLPLRSRNDLKVEDRRTISLVPVTKMVGENSTSLRRSELLVVDPHSMSTLPLTSSAIRFEGVTNRYAILISRPPSSAPTSVAIALHRSIE